MSNALDPHAAIVATASGVSPDGVMRTADGKPLRRALMRSQARARRRAFLLVTPLLLFVLLTFVVPIGQMLQRSFYNAEFADNMPRVTEWFHNTAPGTPPDDAAWTALGEDIKEAAAARTIARAGTRLNYDMSGARSLFTSTGRAARNMEPPYQAALAEIDSRWESPLLWAKMRQSANALTGDFYLAAVDRTRDETGNITSVPQQQQIYVKLFIRTLVLSAVITLTTFVLGFPIAHLLATLPMRKSNLLMILVLLPFWTSLLVRTTSWIVLLQQQGVINDLLIFFGIIGQQSRLQMIYNMTGTIIAMTHILLPFMVLPLYSVMRTINPSYVRAARSLGATSWTAFRRVYFPQTLPGLGAGALLVFILAVGYYITPALVGGASGQLISNMIAMHTTQTLNWSLAAALSTILLVIVLLLYWLYDRMVGIDNLKLG